MLALKVKWRLGEASSQEEFSISEIIIIIGAGHNSKAHAIAYMPLVLAGIILVFNKSLYLVLSLQVWQWP